MPVWVVTGGSGFLGRHLLDRLAGEPAEIVAVGRNHPPGWPGRFVRADFDDRAAVERAVAALRPDVVFHLAGQTPPAQPEDFDRGNTRATVAWLDALQTLGRPVRLVLAGSAGELGPVPVEALPVAEGWPCRPADPYGLSKHRATCAALASPPPVEAVVARIFNPIGPGLPASQALGRFARALAEGTGPITLTVGNLAVRRDFVDVRDVANALLALATRGQAGRVYHVGTGRSQWLGAGLERLIELSGRDVTVHVDPTLGRPGGPTDSRADIGRIRDEVGWTPRIEWDRSLHDLYQNLRSEMKCDPEHLPSVGPTP